MMVLIDAPIDSIWLGLSETGAARVKSWVVAYTSAHARPLFDSQASSQQTAPHRTHIFTGSSSSTRTSPARHLHLHLDRSVCPVRCIILRVEL